jgi:starch synthase
MNVLHITSEVAPYSKTGGLADVASALPRAIARLANRQARGPRSRITVVTPRYRSIDPTRHMLARRLAPIDVPLGARTERVTLYEGKLPGGLVTVYLLDHPLFDREGLYGDGKGADYADNGLRFALLSRAALEVAHRLDQWPDVIHAHDWQAALAPLYVKVGVVPRRPRPATVFTIHNLAFQGLFPKELVEDLGLGWDLFTPEGMEFYGQLSFLKAGVAFADRVTTVSPRYAREIQTAEHGAGMEGFLKARSGKLTGILNGIDADVWNPEKDPHIPVRYDAIDRTGKAACKAALQRELALPVRAQVPVVGMVSRLSEQKGLDIINKVSHDLSQLDAQFVFLGVGDKKYEEALLTMARRYPTKFASRIAYDEPMAHRIEAGSDLFLMPSRFEPCGLNQMYSLRYGTIPIVRAVGGLDDTVVDFDEQTQTGTGFTFDEYSPSALLACVKRAVATFRHQSVWNTLVGRAMVIDFAWEHSAQRYLDIYESLRRPAPEAVAAQPSV